MILAKKERCGELDKGKIIIEITESNVPPKVTVDGERINVISLDYRYDVNSSEHKFNLVMPSSVNGVFQTQGIAFDKSIENN